MKKIIILCWMILQIQITGFSQNQNNLLYLVKKFESETTLDPIQETALNIYNLNNSADNKANTSIIVRLCSQDKIQTALLNSVWLYPTIIETLEGYGFKKQNIIVLKSPDCIITDNKVKSPTEIWISQEKNLLPSYAEKYLANQIEIKEISRSNFYAGDSKYLLNTRKVIKELKKDRSAFGFIKGFYITSSDKRRMNIKINRIKTSIKKSGIKSSACYVGTSKITNWLAMGAPEYPLFYVVKLQTE